MRSKLWFLVLFAIDSGDVKATLKAKKSRKWQKRTWVSHQKDTQIASYFPPDQRWSFLLVVLHVHWIAEPMACYFDFPPPEWMRAERNTATAINWKRNVDQENHHHAIISNRSGHHSAFFLSALVASLNQRGMYQMVWLGAKAATRAFSFKILIITCCYS